MVCEFLKALKKMLGIFVGSKFTPAVRLISGIYLRELLKRVIPFFWFFVIAFQVVFASDSAVQITKTEKKLDEPERVIHSGDLLRLTLRIPAQEGQSGQSWGALNKVEKNGEVATPDGSFIKADGLALGTFRTNFANLYKPIPSYRDAQVDAYISSSPFGVVKYPKDKMPNLTSTNIPPPTIYPRNFRAPYTVWNAIQDEGGIPKEVDASKICILKRNLERKILDCHQTDGKPDGGIFIESGDYLFLVPAQAPVTHLFDKE
jgi:hypothetical protein